MTRAAGAWRLAWVLLSCVLWLAGSGAARASLLRHAGDAPEDDSAAPVIRLWLRDPLPLHAACALVIDARSHRVLLRKNADQVRPIASLTKLMTAVVVLDAHQPMNQRISITRADIDTLKWSRSRLRPGMRFTRARLLQLALMSSENRAAHALARHYPGGLRACLRAMNLEARRLGMSRTHYVDPTGLSPANHSDAHDLALLVEHASRYATIRRDTTHHGTVVHALGMALPYRNSDHLLFGGDWHMVVSKTGFINEAGRCLAFDAVLRGRPVIVVLLDAWGRYGDFVDALHIRAWLRARSTAQWARLPERAPLLH
ncbi:MAG: serine hydrolase [Betaproteobacteria bacterium]|nr:serine hydrolase [Betaproteobacteria bacterium]